MNTAFFLDLFQHRFVTAQNVCLQLHSKHKMKEYAIQPILFRHLAIELYSIEIQIAAKNII